MDDFPAPCCTNLFCVRPYMPSGDEVSQVTRAVANGDGDWADVPRCVREAVMLALSGPSPPTPHPFLGPSLTESAVQRGVRTFADAAALRAEAVRDYAHFHNGVEAMRSAFRQRHRAVWRTAVQLDPELLAVLQRETRRGAADDIPDDLEVPNRAAQRMSRLEALLEELEAHMEATRDVSVRFAAHFLADVEKSALGLDPADLRAADVERRMAFTPPRHASHSAGHTQTESAPRELPEAPQRQTEGSGAWEEPTRSAIRRQYMNSVALANEERFRAEAEAVLARRQSIESTLRSESVIHLGPISSVDSTTHETSL